MSYHRWSSEGQNPCPLYIWMGADGLHVWKHGEDDKDGLFFADGKDTVVAERLMHALYDHLTSNGITVKIRANKMTTRKTRCGA